MTTATPAIVRAPSTRRRWTGARTALALAWHRGTVTVGAARRRYRSPALTIAGLGCLVAAFFQLGLFAGLLAACAACFTYEWLGRPEDGERKAVSRR